jgi:hypothetical protein
MRNPTVVSALDKLQRFGTARNRRVDHDVRTVVLSDDEALALLEYIRELQR